MSNTLYTLTNIGFLYYCNGFDNKTLDDIYNRNFTILKIHKKTLF